MNNGYGWGALVLLAALAAFIYAQPYMGTALVVIGLAVIAIEWESR